MTAVPAVDLRGALPAPEIAPRLERLRALLARDGLDGLLVTRLVNVRYLTGFTGSAAMLLVPAERAVPPTFVTDGRYRDQSAEQLAAAGLRVEIQVGTTRGAQRDALAAAAGAAALTRLGLEAQDVTWAGHDEMSAWFASIELVATAGLVEELRMVKDVSEVARIRRACAVADDALGACAPRLAQRPTEREFAWALEVAMRERGASAMSFDPIVASGPHAAQPHARPSDRVIEPCELVVLDFGCVVDGYCSDMTRTVSVGDPGGDARRLYDTVLAAQQAGRAAVAPGVAIADVDAACRDLIGAAGWGDAFLHGTGHGVGLEIHEAPRVAASVGGTLASGQVVTVEPGVYLTGVGGVRIEDTVVVTAEGHVALTEFPKDLCL